MIDIIKFNNDLIESKKVINIIDYVKEINKISYKIDIDFIDEFIELVEKDECCIHHKLLQKYDIITLNRGSTDIKRMLEQNNFIETPFEIEEGVLECDCGSKRVFSYQKQSRSADEPMSTYATCMACKKQWVYSG